MLQLRSRSLDFRESFFKGRNFRRFSLKLQFFGHNSVSIVNIYSKLLLFNQNMVDTNCLAVKTVIKTER